MGKMDFKKLFLILICLSAIAGLILNLYVALTNPDVVYNAPTITLNFFSYFTIQSNILVLLVSGSWLFNKSIFGKYEKVFMLGALIDITLTFIIVQLILSKLHTLTGLTLFADNLVHVITPILFVGYWLFVQAKKNLSFKNVIYWGVIYSPLYVAYTLIRGPILTPNWYPYPFIDATLLSYGQIAVNVVGLILVFFIIGGVFVLINNMMLGKEK